MSYVALATDRYEDVVKFYGELLGFPVVEQWDRPNARGRRFDTGGMRLEIMDNRREARPLAVGDPADRFHIVVEVDDIDEARARIRVDAPPPQDTSWRARLFQVRDPDGVPITFLQWLSPERHPREKIHGCLATGVGRGSHFTRLDWARRQFIDKLDIDPFPGTINVIVDDLESMSVWDQLRNAPGVRIENPNSGPNDCNARCYKVSIDGRVAAAIVLPETVDYSTNKIEIIAEIGVREALGVDDGDPLTLEIETAGDGS
jgi:catechol 2,3-dioxygenase-like lactoylglutathione lyase family enzyme